MKDFLWRNRLRVSDLPGYTSPHTGRSSRYKEIPFEDVIFEEAGFLPAESLQCDYSQGRWQCGGKLSGGYGLVCYYEVYP